MSVQVDDFFGGGQRDPDDAPLLDFFGDEYDRPIRTEDMLIRHQGDGRPKIWVPENLMIPGPDIEYDAEQARELLSMTLPDGVELRQFPDGARLTMPGPMVLHPHAGKQWFYSRPSSWGDVCEDQTNLNKWETRTVVDGMVMQGQQSETLRLEWASLNREDKKKFRDGANAICLRAKGLVSIEDRKGTALHALTERYDHGLDVRCPPEYKRHLEEWKRLTRHLKIVDLYGEPGIECFVVNDAISCAGTFDRLVRYKPCPNCGGRYYIVDLKSGKVLYGQSTIAVQEAIYANSEKYDVVPNGKAGGAYPGLRRPMPDGVCKCRGIVINIPVDEVAQGAEGTFKWVNIRKGWEAAKGIAADMRAFRSAPIRWMVTDEPEPDLLGLIDDATDRDAVTAVWRQNKALWAQDDEFYTAYASTRLAEFDRKAVI